MPRYILKTPSLLSDSSEKFPLLCSTKTSSDVYKFQNSVWPKRISFLDGQTEELFIGGIIGETEIFHIAKKIAEELADLYSGQRLLLIQILEGAVPFCAMICEQLAQLPPKTMNYDIAGIKVSSYLDGTHAERHQCTLPLHLGNGDKLTSLADYDRIVILDDLIDAGNTFVWLVEECLPSFKPKHISAYFMLEKGRKRSVKVENALKRLGVVCGKQVPDEWVVGYGLDIRLSGKKDQSPLHLFRCRLPGGIYAFNSEIEKKLITEYQKHPQDVESQLRVYTSRA